MGIHSVLAQLSSARPPRQYVSLYEEANGCFSCHVHDELWWLWRWLWSWLKPHTCTQAPQYMQQPRVQTMAAPQMMVQQAPMQTMAAPQYIQQAQTFAPTSMMRGASFGRTNMIRGASFGTNMIRGASFGTGIARAW